MESPEERRKHPRYEGQFPASFQVDTTAGVGLVLNLSKEGCLVESDTSPKQGDYLNVSISLDDRDSPLQIESAAVRWVTGRVFGLQFLYMTQETHERLEAFIDALQQPLRPSG